MKRFGDHFEGRGQTGEGLNNLILSASPLPNKTVPRPDAFAVRGRFVQICTERPPARPRAAACLPIVGGTGMVRATMTEAPTATIAGGFLLLDVRQVLATWHTCKAPTLGIGAFRAYLAAREMVARRRAIGEGRAPAYSAAELARLLGLTERRARALVRHLVAAGLVSWADDAIAFPDPPEVSEGEPLDAIGGGRGDLAIPRRMLRFLARGATAATIATALGVLLRCLSRRRQGFDGRGRVKASWIAGTFGVDLRRVKASRAGLVALGWIVPEPGDQWSANRWGRAFRVALDWRAPASPRIAEACNVSQQFVGLVQHRHYNRCNVGVDTSIEGKDGNAYPQPCAPPATPSARIRRLLATPLS